MAQTGWPAVTREEYEKITEHNYMRSVCYSLWRSPRVNWDGKILGCCWNSWADFGGNAFRDGYVSAINNHKIKYARDMLLGREAPVEGLPCSTCELYKKMKQSGAFLREKEIYNRQSLLYRGARFVYHRMPALKKLKKLMQGEMCSRNG